MSIQHILTLDIGGSAIKYGICDLNGKLTCKGQVPTPCGPEAKIEDLLNAIKGIFEQCQSQSSFEGLAISAPGCITSNGFMRTGGYLFYNFNQPLADLIEKTVGMRPEIINDAKAAAEAELWIGALHGINSGAVLILGTGLGGGLVLDGKVYNGPHGSAGELSAFNMLGRQKLDSPYAYAANIVSTTGLLLKVCQALELEVIFDDDNHYRDIPIDGHKVFELLAEGNTKVQAALEEFGRDAGALIYNLCITLDLEKIAIGGGISCQPALIDAIKRGVKYVHDSSQILRKQPNLLTLPEITVCQFHNDANLVGAMHHFLVVQHLI